MVIKVDNKTVATLHIAPDITDELFMLKDAVNEALKSGVKRLNVNSSTARTTMDATLKHVVCETKKFPLHFSAPFCTEDELTLTVRHLSGIEKESIIVITDYDKATLNRQYNIEEAQKIIEFFIKDFDATLTIVCSEKN